MQLTNDVKVAEDCSSTMSVENLVAVQVAKYPKTPVIGKILQINETEIEVHYWKGKV